MDRIWGSFRDPSGVVFKHDNKIFRSVSELGKERYLSIKNILERSIEYNFLIDTKEINNDDLKKNLMHLYY